MDKNLTYLFVVNPGSGSNTNEVWIETINDFFKDSDKVFEIYHLPEKFDINQIKNHVLGLKPKQVIAVGGDGTVTMLANILAKTNIPLGILPAGSANGMAKELGIPEQPAEALNIIKNGHIANYDLIKINDTEYCLHLSDIGLNAHLIKHFDEGKLRGKLGYASVIFKTLWHKEKMQVIIRTKDKEVKRNAFMVALANATMYGTGAVINPEGQLDDGMFEVIIVRKLALGPLLKMLFKPGLFNSKKIEILCCSSVEINTLRRVHFQIDGEYIGKLNSIKARIDPGAISLILPQPTT